MALQISEDWVRERVQLKHNNLEDVRSLALPGTYHEKIVSLGDGLRNFTRLKSLDLSRNAIESLKGLENVKLLEKLNLYYNNIESLTELRHLQHQQKLQELDLRLNPVARNEPDYRLFLIHMLPNLRRLDDRSVRDGERKASLLHFSSEQASELVLQEPPTFHQAQRSQNPRAKHVESLAKPPSLDAENDAGILDLVSRDLYPAAPITGSSAANPAVQEYSPQVARELDVAGGDHPSSCHVPPLQLQHLYSQMPTEASLQAADTQHRTGDGDMKSCYPNLSQLPLPEKPQHHQQISSANCQVEDEIEAYTSYKAQGHFTPHPGQHTHSVPEKPFAVTEDSTRSQVQQEHISNRVDAPHSMQRSAHPVRWELHGDDGDLTNSENGRQSAARLDYALANETEPSAGVRKEPVSRQQHDTSFTEEPQELPSHHKAALQTISDLTDKYWNGSKSLMKNQRFKSQFVDLITGLQGPLTRESRQVKGTDYQEVAQLREALSNLQIENKQLREHNLGGGESGDDSKVKMALARSQRDLIILRGRLQNAMEENASLQEQLDSRKHEYVQLQEHPSAPRMTNVHDNDAISRENEVLKHEISSLNIRLKQASQMQELASMLQQSHKSLVQTNEHLLKELEHVRPRTGSQPGPYKQPHIPSMNGNT